MNINSKQFLTVAGNEKPTDSNSWDQVVDYSGLSFFQSDVIQSDIINQPELSSLSTDIPDKLRANPSINYDVVIQQKNGTVNPFWTLLDSQSTVDVFVNGFS